MRQYKLQKLGVAELRWRSSFPQMHQKAMCLIPSHIFDLVFPQIDIERANCQIAQAVILSQKFERMPWIKRVQLRQHLLPYLNL